MRRVLAVRQDNNGDVTLIGPALRALARAARVTLLCGPGGFGAAQLLPGVDETLVARAEWIEGRPQPLDPGATMDVVRRIAARAFDEAVIFTSFHQSPLPAALLLRLAGVPRIGAISVDYPGSLLDVRVSVDDDIHEVQRALHLARACGYDLAPGDDDRLRYVPLPPPAFALPARFVAIQPGASVGARAWAPERHRDLVAALAARGYRVVVTGSDAERALTAYVAGDTSALDLGGKTTFAEFAAIVARADAIVVGNSSGIHAGAAVGTPVVSIFPPTIPPVRFAPWRVPHVLLGDHAIACAGCRARTCPVPGQPCTGGVSASDVLDALEALGVRPTAVPA